MPRAFLLETPPMDAYAQMAMDEAVLESAQSDACYLRIYRWSGTGLRAVTFGYSQAYGEVESAVRRKVAGIVFPLVRRSTGGGVVYHDGDLTFSFVFPWVRLIAPSLIYKNIHLGIHVGLKAQGLASRLWSPGSKAEPEGAAANKEMRSAAAPGSRAVPRFKARGVQAECFTAPEPMDLVHENGDKLLGGALRRRQGFGLYQGSMRPEGLAVSLDRLRRALTEGFSLQWGALFRPEPPQPEVSAAAARLIGRKYRTDSWNHRR